LLIFGRNGLATPKIGLSMETFMMTRSIMIADALLDGRTSPSAGVHLKL
jgi:hypothetical protein